MLPMLAAGVPTGLLLDGASWYSRNRRIDGKATMRREGETQGPFPPKGNQASPKYTLRKSTRVVCNLVISRVSIYGHESERRNLFTKEASLLRCSALLTPTSDDATHATLANPSAAIRTAPRSVTQKKHMLRPKSNEDEQMARRVNVRRDGRHWQRPGSFAWAL